MISKLTHFIFCLPLLTVTILVNAQAKPTPAPDRLKGLEQRKILAKKSLLDSIPFRNIGPSVMSGRVVDLEVNPEDPTEFYVAYATGGLWYSANNGQSFTSIFDNEEVMGIGDIAVNWKTGAIWVGTGEVNSSRSSYAGTGVYKSSDKGKSWHYLGLPESHHIGKIQLHPSDDNTAWIAVLGHLYSSNKERGVYKTTDGGATWKQTLFIDNHTGVVDIDINPQNPLELYAAAWYKTRSAWNFEEAGKTSGLYKSSDGGNSWVLLSKEGSGFPIGDGVGRIGVAVYPKNPQVVYAILDNNFRKPDTALKKEDSLSYELRRFEKITKEEFAQLTPQRLDTFLKRNKLFPRYNANMLLERVSNGSLKPNALWEFLFDANTALLHTPIIGAEIYRSENGGQSWKKTNTKDLPSLYNTYGYYFGKIYVSPVNDQKIIVTGFTIQLSEDGGKTFEKIDKDNVHADHHACWINPKKDSHFFSGNDGGLNITYDDGEHWFKANAPAVGQFYSVTTDNAKPYNVYGGLQDNGVWWGPSTHTENVGWQSKGHYGFLEIAGGDGMQVQVDSRDNLTTYTGFQFGNYFRLNRSNPRPSKRLTPLSQLGQKPLRFNWQTPILLSTHNQDVLYLGSNKFHRSLNKADTLVELSADLTKGGKTGDVPYGTITSISESPLRFGLLYLGTDDGNIQLSKDGGNNWSLISAPQKRSAGLPQGLWVSRITASKFKESRVYVSLNGYRNDDFFPYLFKSEDYGTTWRQIGKDLPAEPVNVVKEDPKNEQIIYAGTDGGLYASFDAGNSFMMWHAGLPMSIPVHDIAIQERENEIVLGTHGRSIYIAKLEDVQGLQKDKDWLKKKPKPKEKAKEEEEDDEREEEEFD